RPHCELTPTPPESHSWESLARRGLALPPVAQKSGLPISAGVRVFGSCERKAVNGLCDRKAVDGSVTAERSTASAVRHLRNNPESQGQFSQTKLRNYAKRNKH